MVKDDKNKPTTQEEKDEAMKAEIKASLSTQRSEAAADTTKKNPPPPAATSESATTTQEAADEALKEQIKSSLKQSEAQKLAPPVGLSTGQADQGEGKPVAAPAASVAETQTEKDAEMKKQITESMSQPLTPVVPPSAPKTQEEKDADMKKQIKQSMTQPQTPVAGDVSAAATSASSVGAGAAAAAPQTQEEKDAEMKRQIKDSMAQPQTPDGAGVISKEAVGSPDEGDEGTAEPSVSSRRLVGVTTSTGKQRPAPVEGEAQPGAYNVQGRAIGGLPAWIRDAQNNNNAAGGAGSNVPPEMANLPPEMRNLPPEMRGAAEPEASAELEESPAAGDGSPESVDPENLMEADVKPVEALDQDKQKRKKMLIFLIILIILGVGIGVGVTVSGSGDDGNGDGSEDIIKVEAPRSTPSPTPVIIPASCPSSGDLVDPNFDNIELVVLLGLAISELFPLAIPDFQEPKDSDGYCDPQYLGLVWLAHQESMGLNFSESELIERYALSVFFLSLNPQIWNSKEGWLNTTMHHCQWYGIECTDGNVTGIELPENALGKTDGSATDQRTPMPSEIGLLQNLRTLNVRGNFISGPLPSEIGLLTNLEVFNMRGCKLITSLPETFGELTSLGKICFE